MKDCFESKVRTSLAEYSKTRDNQGIFSASLLFSKLQRLRIKIHHIQEDSKRTQTFGQLIFYVYLFHPPSACTTSFKDFIHMSLRIAWLELSCDHQDVLPK